MSLGEIGLAVLIAIMLIEIVKLARRNRDSGL